MSVARRKRRPGLGERLRRAAVERQRREQTERLEIQRQVKELFKRLKPPSKRKPPKPSFVQRQPRRPTGAAARARRGIISRVAKAKAAGIWYPKKKRKAPSKPWFGPMHELGDDTVLEILPTDVLRAISRDSDREVNDFAQVLYAANPQFTWQKLWRALFATWVLVRDELFRLMGPEDESDTGPIPFDTGDLKTSIYTAIRKDSTIPTSGATIMGNIAANRSLLLVIMNTKGVPYASVVNQMPTKMVAHPHPRSPNIGRTGLPLNDPQAKKGGYSLVLLNGQNFARKVAIPQFWNSLSPGGRNNLNFYKSLFEIHYK